MSPRCPDCQSYLVAHFQKGDLHRLYVQHLYGSQCRGLQEELDIAEWLVQNTASSAPVPVQRRIRRVRDVPSAPRRPFTSPRTDRTPTGRLRSR